MPESNIGLIQELLTQVLRDSPPYTPPETPPDPVGLALAIALLEIAKSLDAIQKQGISVRVAK